MIAQPDLRNLFFQECDEQLVELENGLGELQAGGGDDETINAVFRAVHSIKGGAGAFDLGEIVHFAHVFENTLDLVRTGRLSPHPALLALMLRATDILADLVAARTGGPPRRSRSLRRHPGRSRGGGRIVPGRFPAGGECRIVRVRTDRRVARRFRRHPVLRVRRCGDGFPRPAAGRVQAACLALCQGRRSLDPLQGTAQDRCARRRM